MRVRNSGFLAAPTISGAAMKATIRAAAAAGLVIGMTAAVASDRLPVVWMTDAGSDGVSQSTSFDGASGSMLPEFAHILCAETRNMPAVADSGELSHDEEVTSCGLPPNQAGLRGLSIDSEMASDVAQLVTWHWESGGKP